jgi:thiaminase
VVFYSVAGRGVFSTKDLVAGEQIISIPYHAALTQGNGALNFPNLAKELLDIRTKNTQKQSDSHYLMRLWNRIRRRQSTVAKETNAGMNAEEYWKEELTAYALEALEQDHPWATWIEQWQRSDPMQTLVDQGTWTHDNLVYTDIYPNGIAKSIHTAVNDFQKMAPDIPEYKIGAAVGIRLEMVDDYLSQYSNKVRTSASRYTLAISRAVGLTKHVTAIIPMHDMINHSTQSNVEMTYNEDDGSFSIIASKDIPKETELFIRYMDVSDEEGNWDDGKATWLLAQWGIPSSPMGSSANVDATSSREKSLVDARSKMAPQPGDFSLHEFVPYQTSSH